MKAIKICKDKIKEIQAIIDETNKRKLKCGINTAEELLNAMNSLKSMDPALVLTAKDLIGVECEYVSGGRSQKINGYRTTNTCRVVRKPSGWFLVDFSKRESNGSDMGSWSMTMSREQHDLFFEKYCRAYNFSLYKKSAAKKLDQDCELNIRVCEENYKEIQKCINMCNQGNLSYGVNSALDVLSIARRLDKSKICQLLCEKEKIGLEVKYYSGHKVHSSYSYTRVANGIIFLYTHNGWYITAFYKTHLKTNEGDEYKKIVSDVMFEKFKEKYRKQCRLTIRAEQRGGKQ